MNVMTMKNLWLGAAVAMLMADAASADSWQLAGHDVALMPTEDGGYRLTADGALMLEDGLILDDGAHTVPGGAVIFGVAGPGGNVCDAAPFAVWLPEGGPARLDGPIDTCAYLQPRYTGSTVVWTSDSLPGRLTESWVWTADAGITALPSTPFAPDKGRGWDNILGLDGQHPTEALRLEPVWQVLVQGMSAPDLQAFAERLSGLGSGSMVGPDYYGEACDKFACDTDYAGIWLQADTRQVYVFWAQYGDAAPKLFPADRSLWPDAALAKLAEHGG